MLYNLTRRGIEYDLLPWCRTRGIPVMAYSPLEQGRLDTAARRFTPSPRAFSATPAQVALAWVLRQPGVMAIPKAGNVEHVRENHAALDFSSRRKISPSSTTRSRRRRAKYRSK